MPGSTFLHPHPEGNPCRVGLIKMDNVHIIVVFSRREYRNCGGVSSTASSNFGGPWLNIIPEINIIQGGSNMTGTDLYVKKPHCAAAVRPWESEATTSTLPPARLEPVQSCLGVARVMSEQKVPRSVEQRIVIKFLVAENVPSAEIHHRLQQQYGEECLRRRHSSPYFPIF